ncbi:uncharacterized protein LOC142098618 [Mixophyes fleayi]|uniref:uncharacterized protein LOC142098618 n=1 Tax=Mixophyes fleayi TaxID=3061075 RepID=UPI003F4E18D3
MTELENLLERILRHTPGTTLQNSTHGYQRVALQMFGYTGHGKSSLINSCLCVVKNEGYQNLSGAGQSDGAMTRIRKEHNLTNTLVMIDNRGFNKLKLQENLEACAQLRSLRDFEEVTWEENTNLAETLRQLPLKYSNRPADFIVPVLVYSATLTWNRNDGSVIEKLITNAFRITGIHPIVVITRCAAENVDEIVRKFGDLGVMRRLCLENYTENEPQRSPQKDKKILEFLHACIEEAERGIRMSQNQDHQTKFVTQAAEQIKQESDVLREEIRKLKESVPSKNRCSPS